MIDDFHVPRFIWTKSHTHTHRFRFIPITVCVLAGERVSDILIVAIYSSYIFDVDWWNQRNCLVDIGQMQITLKWPRFVCVCNAVMWFAKPKKASNIFIASRNDSRAPECEWKASIGKFRSDPHWMRSHAKYCRWKKYKTAESISMRPTWNVISEALSCLFAILFIPMMHSNRKMKWLTHYGSPWIGYPTVEHGAAAVARAVASISIALRVTTKAGAYPIKQNNKQTKGQNG